MGVGDEGRQVAAAQRGQPRQALQQRLRPAEFAVHHQGEGAGGAEQLVGDRLIGGALHLGHREPGESQAGGDDAGDQAEDAAPQAERPAAQRSRADGPLMLRVVHGQQPAPPAGSDAAPQPTP
jgi:hypothetical protein